MLTRSLIPSGLRRAFPTKYKNDVFSDLQRSMDRFADSFFGEPDSDFSALSERAAEFLPKVEVEETETSLKVTAELPGLTEKDVDVQVEGDYLTVKGEKKSERESNAKGRYFSERSFGSFERTMRLPENVDKSKIDAKIDHGVLRVTLPKSPTQRPDVKKIPVKH